jgi:hypothetical protein
MQKLEKKIIQKTNKGFTLLIAIVITSMLMIVGFAVTNVAYRQFLLSDIGRYSQYAFYAAESGVECALFYDLKNTGGLSAFATSSSGTIFCNGQNILTGTQTIPIISQPSLIGGGGNASPTSRFFLTFPNSCVIVSVTKATDGSTTIQSKGYNTCSATFSRYERGVTMTY